MNAFEDNLWEAVVDRHGDDLSQMDAPVATRIRHQRPRVLAGATLAVAGSATAVTLLVGSASPPPAFAVTRLHNGSVSVKINRKTSLAAVNRKLGEMGIEKIGRSEWAGKRATADDAAATASSIPNCASVPAGWKGQWEQMAGSSSGPGYSISESVAPGTWVLVYCYAGNPPSNPLGTAGSTGSGNTGNTGNTGAG